MKQRTSINIDLDVYRKAKSRASGEGLYMRGLIEKLLKLYGDGKVDVKEEVKE